MNNNEKKFSKNYKKRKKNNIYIYIYINIEITKLIKNNNYITYQNQIKKEIIL